MTRVAQVTLQGYGDTHVMLPGDATPIFCERQQPGHVTLHYITSDFTLLSTYRYFFCGHPYWVLSAEWDWAFVGAIPRDHEKDLDTIFVFERRKKKADPVEGKRRELIS